MEHSLNLKDLLSRLWVHVASRRRKQCFLLLILMIVTAFTEVFGIAAVIPFLRVLTAPNLFFEHPLAEPVIVFFRLSEPGDLLLPVTTIFCGAAVLAGSMRLLLLWASTRLSHAIGADFSFNVYHRTLHQPYAIHLTRNSSETINTITGKTRKLVTGVVMPFLTFVSSAILLTSIIIMLIAVNPLVAVSAIAGFSMIYGIIIRVTKLRLRENSERIAKESTNVIKALQEGLGGIRDVLIDGKQHIYCKTYRDADIPMRRAMASNGFLAMAPRYGIEALGMLLIGLIAYNLVLQEGGFGNAVPILGVFALGSQRLLPILQQGYNAWANVQGSRASIIDSLAFLDQTLPDSFDADSGRSDSAPLNFEDAIRLQEVGFRYAVGERDVLRDVRLYFRRGERIGIIGETGSGKSTLLDLLMGLLKPTTGDMYVDDTLITEGNQRAWQKHIAHVPQSIFLTDSSVKENIAFGIELDQIDMNRVRLAARRANIADTIEKWTAGYNTVVGERGVRLSGGQRQRIGIARALYKRADVIIFDEATSALDSVTENAVMKSLEELGGDLTIFLVAHRVTTLKNCSLVVEISDGRVRQMGSYSDVIQC